MKAKTVAANPEAMELWECEVKWRAFVDGCDHNRGAACLAQRPENGYFAFCKKDRCPGWVGGESE